MKEVNNLCYCTVCKKFYTGNKGYPKCNIEGHGTMFIIRNLVKRKDKFTSGYAGLKSILSFEADNHPTVTMYINGDKK